VSKIKGFIRSSLLKADFEASLREAGYLPTLYTGTLAIKSRLGNFPKDEWYVTAADSDLDR